MRIDGILDWQTVPGSGDPGSAVRYGYIHFIYLQTLQEEKKTQGKVRKNIK